MHIKDYNKLPIYEIIDNMEVPTIYIERFKKYNSEYNQHSNFNINLILLSIIITSANIPIEWLNIYISKNKEKEISDRNFALLDYTIHTIYSLFNDRMEKMLLILTSNDGIKSFSEQIKSELTIIKDTFNKAMATLIYTEFYKNKAKKIRKETNIKSLLKEYTEDVYSMQINPEILNKVPDSLKKMVIDFHKNTREYLKTKLLNTTEESKVFYQTSETKETLKIKFDDLFNNSKDMDFAINLMTNLKVIDDQSVFLLPLKKRSGLLGVINALKDERVISNQPEKILLTLFAARANTYYSRLKSESDTYINFYNRALKEIKAYKK